MTRSINPPPAPHPRFWEIEEPALALRALEAELAAILGPEPDPYEAVGTPALAAPPRRSQGGDSAASGAALAEATERLRVMLERECTEHAARAAARRAEAAEAAAALAAIDMDVSTPTATLGGLGSASGGGAAPPGSHHQTSGSGAGAGGGVVAAWTLGVPSGGLSGIGSRNASADALLPLDSSLPVLVSAKHLKPDPGQDRDPSIIGE